MFEEGVDRAKDVIKKWQMSDVSQELQDALDKIDFSSSRDCLKISLEASPTVYPGSCVITRYRSPFRDSGTVGCLCKMSSEANSLIGRQYALTCAHVVGTEDAECLVFTGQTNKHLARLGTSEVVLKQDDYRNCTLDIAAIRVENKKLCLEPFTSQEGILMKLSPLEFREGNENLKRVRKDLIGRRVQKIGAKTNLTYGVVKQYHPRLRIEEDNRMLVNVIEVEWFSGENGVTKFSDNGDSGAVVTDVLDDTCPNPFAIGVHFARCKEGKCVSSLCLPLQHALGALSSDLSHIYRQNVTLELYFPDTDLPGST